MMMMKVPLRTTRFFLLLYLHTRLYAVALSSIQKSAANMPWYSDARIDRDRSHVIGSESDMPYHFASSDDSRFILFLGKGVVHREVPGTREARPIFLSASETNDFLVKSSRPILEELVGSDDPGSNRKEDIYAIWVGKLDGKEYCALYCDRDGDDGGKSWGLIEGATLKPLREFGDRLESEKDAAILATANGLIQFHNSHKYCSYCGSKTAISKAGGCRRCVDADCKRSVYPRLDVATIMLITSHCGQYALLGRKANWPRGRYSTLAGFAEVGETLEECCIRETYEESGIKVDRDSVHFVASQPWPFPSSLMVGFQANTPQCDDGDQVVPAISTDEDEMQDIRWFSKDYVSQRLSGSTALDYIPSARETEFHIPGKSSLARLLITRWVES